MRTVLAVAALTLACAAALPGCQSVDVGADYDLAADFAAWKSWAWAPGGAPGTGPDSADLNERRIHASVERVLAERRYSKAEPAVADFLVAVHTRIDRKREYITHYSGPNWYGGWYGGRWYGGGWASPGWATTSAWDYDVGTLFLDLIDRRTATVAWQGWATSVLDPDLTPAEREARIDESVRKMLAQFPPATVVD